jgi:hypothetical protein
LARTRLEDSLERTSSSCTFSISTFIAKAGQKNTGNYFQETETYRVLLFLPESLHTSHPRATFRTSSLVLGISQLSLFCLPGKCYNFYHNGVHIFLLLQPLSNCCCISFQSLVYPLVSLIHVLFIQILMNLDHSRGFVL